MMRICEICCIGLLVAGGCGRKIVEEPPRTVVQARVEPCTELCEAQFTACGPGAAPAFEDVSGCIEECSTVEGAFARFWAYQTDTQRDACFDEFLEQIECTADVWRRCISEDPSHVHPCSQEISAAGHCANPYVRGGG